MFCTKQLTRLSHTRSWAVTFFFGLFSVCFWTVYIRKLSLLPFQRRLSWSLSQQAGPGDTLFTTPSTPTNCSSNSTGEFCLFQTSHVIHPHPYRFLLNEPGLCNTSNVTLLVLITSKIDAAPARLAQRQTWATVGRIPDSGVKVAFLFGATPSANFQQALIEESNRYGDILQEDFVDTYQNLTLKTVMALRWASLFCPQAQYVMKTDSDMYVHIPNVLKYLGFLGPRKSVLLGAVNWRAKPIRSRKSKWYAPPEVYPMATYPPFASGTCYVMSGDMPARLFAMSQRTPFFHLEDVFVGLCLKKLGIRARSHPAFKHYHVRDTACAYKDIFSGHYVSPNAMRRIWSELSDSTFKCAPSSPRILMKNNNRLGAPYESP